MSGVGSRASATISQSNSNDVILGEDPANGGGISNHRQIVFKEEQSETTWTLKIADDDKHEGVEQFEVQLVDPVLSVHEFETNGGHKVAHIDIIDDEDS